MKHNSYLLIDTAALAENIRTIRAGLGNARLAAVIKGDAYGLGAVPMARTLRRLGVDALAVSHVSEGLELRADGETGPVWLLSIPPDFLAEEAAAAELSIPLGSFRQFDVLKDVSLRLGRPVEVQLKLDTGLHRIGFLPEELPSLCGALKEYAPYLRMTGTFSHFADAIPASMDRQFELFLSLLEELRARGIDPGLRHISSSAPMEHSARYDLDAVRVGRRLYMDNPVSPTGGIREVASFRAFLTDVRVRRAGETLAYNSACRLEKDTRIGVLSVGYGDGLDLGLVAVRAPVLVRGKRVPLLAACMDQSFVDLSGTDAAPGDEVTLFGTDGQGNLLSSQYVAGLIGSNEGCGLTAALSPRVERRYI